MGSAPYRGVVKDGNIVFLEEAPALPEGTEVLITPVKPLPGSAAAVLAAMNADPQVSDEDVDELERMIAQGRVPLSYQDPFAEEAR